MVNEPMFIQIGDYQTEIYKSYTIKWDLFSGVGYMEFEIEPTVSINLTAKAVPFVVALSGSPIMLGYVDKVVRSYSKNSNSLRIMGRDMMQVLADNYILDPKPYENMTIDAIRDDVWNTSKTRTSLHGLNAQGQLVTTTLAEPIKLPEISFRSTAPAAELSRKIYQFQKVRTNHGQTLFDFYSSMYNPVGIVMYVNPGTTEIIFHRVNDPKEAMASYNFDAEPATDESWPITNLKTNSEYNNVISCDYTQDVTNYYKFIKLLGASEPEMNYNEVSQSYDMSQTKLWLEKIESDDLHKGFLGLPKIKVASVNSVDINVWLKTRETLINNQLLQQNRTLHALRYTVAGHTSETAHYFVNHLATVNDDILHIKNEPFLVYSVEYNGTKDRGQTTTMELCRPGAFSNVIDSTDVQPADQEIETK